MKDLLIVFAKEPKAGKVKTRLQGYLSKKMCVKLYKAFLTDTLELARGLKCFDKVLAYTSTARQPEYLRTIAGGFLFYKQTGRGLGERMHNAFKFARRMNSHKTVLIGSDSPNLPAKYIKEAYGRLDKSDIVLGPSQDGGYYLIGLKEPCGMLFKGIKWGSETVFDNTVKNAENTGKKLSILEKWYDVDDYAGLALLKKDLEKEKKSAPCVRKLLKI
ncbi:MAG: TIGR04282 family arsenosugar biosynthesis glycosyltransferase [Candidatus Omnitrophica bacterium]|nr:TIGR04282 family arsenosugar biosynthesis glycosyltransferase [Candidatus Omnitrophota bacterium]